MALLFCLPILMISCKKEGCTDQLALNYNSEAKKDDGSCKYSTVGTLQVTVKDVNGNKLSGKTVSLYKGTYDDYLYVVGKPKDDWDNTNSSGAVTFKNLEPGPYTTSVADGQHEPLVANITVAAGQTKTITMTLLD